jgi:hypothetical protein
LGMTQVLKNFPVLQHRYYKFADMFHG